MVQVLFRYSSRDLWIFTPCSVSENRTASISGHSSADTEQSISQHSIFELSAFLIWVKSCTTGSSYVTFRDDSSEVHFYNRCCFVAVHGGTQHSGITYGAALVDYSRAVLRGGALFVMSCPRGQFGRWLIGPAHFIILYLAACNAPRVRLDHGGTGVVSLPFPWCR